MVNHKTTRVDFFGIGVQKSATTWLFDCLEQHPQVLTASGGANKELNFFNHNFELGYPWYHARFAFDGRPAGEFSPLYFYDRNVPARLYAYRPDARLVVSLRNPVDRAFSQHLHEVRRNRLSGELVDFRKALELNPTYIDQGRYASHLERWLEYFPIGRLHVIWYDDVVSRADEVLARLFAFIGVDSGFRPAFAGERRNESVVYRRPRLRKFVHRAGQLTRSLFGGGAFRRISRSAVPRLIRQATEAPVPDVLIPSSVETRKRLYEAFSDDIERLERMLDRDLSHWKL
jgi:hypothetical protein